MSHLAIDSRVAIHLLTGNPLVPAAIRDLQIGLPEPTVKKLLAIATGVDVERIRAFIADCSVWEVTDEVLDRAPALRELAKPQNRPVEEAIVAAICLGKQVPLLTTNRHFKLYERSGLIVRLFPA